MVGGTEARSVWTVAGRQVTWKSIWPTLLSASAGAASRAKKTQRSTEADVISAVILARTAYDTFLNEFIEVRQLPVLIQLDIDDHSAWHEIPKIVASAMNKKGIRKAQKKLLQPTRSIGMIRKTQAILLLMDVTDEDEILKNFQKRFSALHLLNALRNRLIHHEGRGVEGAEALNRQVRLICSAAGVSKMSDRAPWETILQYAEVGAWSCEVVARSILLLEQLEKNRSVPFDFALRLTSSSLHPLKLVEVEQ